MSRTEPSARALVLESPQRLVERMLRVPEVRDDDALLRVEACGLCGTDHEQFTGALPSAGPFVPGHEIVGVIEELGPAAAKRWGVAAGDRVAVAPFQSCRTCERCIAGDQRHCVRHGLHDAYGFVPVSVEPGLWGGYAERTYLAPDAVLLPVPTELDPVLATVFNPLGAGIQWAVDVPGTRAGDVVAVLGPGIRGLSAAAAAKRAGAATVLVTGRGPRDADRLALASRFGADFAVDVEQEDPVRVLRRETGGLADIVVDVTAKAPAAFVQALHLARPGGTIVVAGTRGTSTVRDFSPDLLVLKELRLVGALGVDEAAYRPALELLATGTYPFDELPRRVAPLEGAADLLRAMAGEGATPPVHGVIAP